MAVVALTVQDQLALMLAGAAPTLVAASSDGHTVDNPAGAEVNLWIQNSSASPITATIKTARKSNFGTFPDKTLTIPAQKVVVLPIFAAQRFTDPATSKLTFTLSAVSSVTVGAVRSAVYLQEA